MEDWWVSCYAVEIHDHLRQLEKKRPVFRAQSPQLHIRENLVDWVCLVSEKRNLCPPVQHLAVYLLDVFMDNHRINEDHLNLFCLGCILVAAKLEEKDNLIPRTSELNAVVGNMYKLSEFMQMELEILNFFEWEILIPTAAHFLEYFAQDGVHPLDLRCGRPFQNFNKAEEYMKCYLFYFLSISLHDHAFLKFRPSLVAASCLAATRICLLVTPLWPPHLEKLTYYKREQLTSCIELMLRILEMEQKAAKADGNKVKHPSSTDSSPCRSGCVSSSPCSSPTTRSTIVSSSPSDCD